MSEELIQQFKDLYFTQNKTRAEIKEILDINEYQIKKLLKIVGVRKVAPKQLKQDILAIVSIEEIKEYFQTHSRKNTANHFGITEQNLKDLMKKYNFHHTSQQKSMIRAKTCQEIYGVDCVFQRQDVREMCTSKEAITKMVNTQRKNNLTKYGVEYQWQRSEVKQKSIQTNIKRFGVKNWAMTDEGKLKLSTLHKSKEYQTREISTKRKNKTFNTSNIEKVVYQILLDYYGSSQVEYQYKSEEYPFNCDFYIKNLNTFIELNAHRTHGPHPFNKDNPEDIVLLNKWKERARTSKFYKQAIYTWTVRDVKKLDCLKEKKLNFLIIYPKDIIEYNNIDFELTTLLTTFKIS